LIEVSCLTSTIRQPSSSFLGFKASTGFVFGRLPTATKIPSALRIFPLLSFTSSTKNFQAISSTSSFSTNSIFAAFFACSIQISSALKVSLL